jgi:transcriptional regulator with XRE-family HTH domain
MITDWKALAKKMQAARQAQNLTIDQLAEQLGRSPDYLALEELAFVTDQVEPALLSQRLKVAQFPASLVERVLAGALNRETARKRQRCWGRRG